MSNDAMTTKEAATLLLAVDVPQPVAQAIGVVLDRLDALEALVGEPTGTVYAARWPADAEEGAEEEIEVCETREAAERVVGTYRGPELVQAVRGPWIAVQS